MGCGSSLPAERLDGGGSAALAAVGATSPSGQTVTVASKPTKAASRSKDRRSSSQPADGSRRQSSLSQPSEKPQRHSNQAIVPMLAAAAAFAAPASSSFSPAVAHSSSSSLSLPESSERGDGGKLRPSVVHQRLSSETASAPQQAASPRSAGRTLDGRPASPPSDSSSRAAASPRNKSKVNSISSPSPSLLERQQRGSSSQPLAPLKTLPPLKMKGRASTSIAATEGWVGKDEGRTSVTPASPRAPKRQEESSGAQEPQPAAAEKTASPRMSKMMSRSSVMLPVS